MKESKVYLQEPEHRYFDETGKEYHGITSVIKKHLFPHEYDNVPEHVLKRAQERGTHIHSSIELWDVAGLGEDEIIPVYQEKLRVLGLVHVASEFIVNDDYFATPIDKIYKKDGEYYLADIKTTYVLNREYVSWQLSICEYLFNLLNPDIPIKGYLAIHIKEDVIFTEVSKIPQTEVKELLKCEREGKEFYKKTIPMPLEYNKASKDIQHILQQADYWAAKKKELQEELNCKMQESNVKKWENDFISFTRKEDTTRESFDTKTFKRDYPELYKKYVILSNVKGSVTIKSKQNLLEL